MAQHRSVETAQKAADFAEGRYSGSGPKIKALLEAFGKPRDAVRLLYVLWVLWCFVAFIYTHIEDHSPPHS